MYTKEKYYSCLSLWQISRDKTDKQTQGRTQLYTVAAPYVSLNFMKDGVPWPHRQEETQQVCPIQNLFQKISSRKLSLTTEC
jgi:hypothetical protein